MIPIKNKEEISIIRAGGERLARIMEKTIARIKPGLKLSDLDKFIEELIIEEGAAVFQNGAELSLGLLPEY